MSAGQNISRSIHNLWSNSPVVRAQVYQTIVTRLKTLRWPKNYISLSPVRVNLLSNKDSLGLAG